MRGWHEKIAAFPIPQPALPDRPHFRNLRIPTMEAEHINQIGAQLADLAARTEDLRRYL